MSIASATTVAIALTVLSIFLVLAFNVEYMAHTLESQVQLVAYTHEDFHRELYRDVLLRRIKNMDGVSDVTFVTKEEALERLRDQFGEQRELLDGIEEMNPLRDSFEITVPVPERVDEVAASVSELTSIESVSYEQEVLNRLFRLTNAVRMAGLVLVALLALATIFIISNTVRLTVYARRREIGIMKLVGATDAFIRWPFLLEGAILGLLGGLVAAGVTWWGYSRVVEGMGQALPFVPVIGLNPFLWRMTQLLVLLGLLIGASGAVLSMRRFLKV